MTTIALDLNQEAIHHDIVQTLKLHGFTILCDRSNARDCDIAAWLVSYDALFALQSSHVATGIAR